MRTAHAAKLASRVGLSSTISPKPPVPREQQSDWAWIKQGYEVVLPDRSEAILAKGDSPHREDFEAKGNVGYFSSVTAPAPYSARRNPESTYSSRDEPNRRPDLDLCTFHDHQPRQEPKMMQVPTGRGVGELFGSSEAMPDHSISSGIVPDRFRAGRESLSVIRNVTIRESKRPKARLQDHEYNRRSSIYPSTRIQLAQSGSPPMGNMIPTNRPESSTRGGLGVQRDLDIEESTHRQTRYGPFDFGSRKGMPPTPQMGTSTGENEPGPDWFEIVLIFEGIARRHRVFEHMLVSQLVVDAAILFRISAEDVVLMLFGMLPATLMQENRISDPPRVGPGTVVLVFCIAGATRRDQRNQSTNPDGNNISSDGTGAQIHSSGGFASSKILGNFKLPKFDGNARYWKTWDKTFVRYLSIHNLDFVLEEAFLAILPLSTRDFSANKMVYYILEDAVTPGSLAAKYLRGMEMKRTPSSTTDMYFLGPKRCRYCWPSWSIFVSKRIRVLPGFVCVCGRYSRTLKCSRVRHPSI